MKGGKATAEDEKFIERTLELAKSAAKNGNFPFGAIFVNENKEIIFEAENTVNTENDGTCHAEMNLISRGFRKLGADALKTATLYTSTEPCGMCSGAIHWSHVPKVVYSCSNAELGKIILQSKHAGTDGKLGISSEEVFNSYGDTTILIKDVLAEKGTQIHKNFFLS
eukprot:TRINITY_DN10678_c0_g1_i1.p1 TRINITY_DN10678_c0_g1~~TRINITY_DN10678_c0_g1_i1.p1  ORF type:complete len:167 (+),score=31.28 TRINITY_DN10678_c0_g1_i1:59-559(+)